MKRLVALVLMLLVAFWTFATGESETKKAVDYKIGIMTGTVTQNEEEYRMAEQMQLQFGEDKIMIRTYPDRFMQEQETTISQMMALASDPKTQAIIMVQAVPGAAAAVDKVREVRPDLLIILGVPAEDPDMISKKGDIIFNTDDIGRGYQIIDHAKKLGAETFVHYSFPRHMSYELLAKRRDLMKERSAQVGIRFVEQDSPDPTGDAGVPGTQQFIMEDVPRKVTQYGKNTAFFGTNCAMQEPLIRQVMAGKAIYPVQCCPSPYHAMPGALGIAVPSEKKGDLNYVLAEITSKVTAAGMNGRVGTWPIPVNMSYIQVGTLYAIEYIEGRTQGKLDKPVLQGIYNKVAGGVQLSEYKNYPHHFLILMDHIVF